MKLLFLRTVEDCSVSLPFLYFKKRPHVASFSTQTAAHDVSQHTVQTQTPETQMKDVRSTDAGSTWFGLVDLETPQPEYIVVERPPIETKSVEIQTDGVEEEGDYDNSLIGRTLGLFRR